jgi:hypothetical protein
LSQLSKDPDFDRFLKDLQNTEEGRRWRLSWFGIHGAVKQLNEIGKAEPDTRYQSPKMYLARLAYINASNEGSEAIHRLTVIHNWPPESKAGAFIYQPPKSQLPRRTKP